MFLLPYLHKELVLPELAVCSKQAVLVSLVDALCTVYSEFDKDAILSVLNARERLGSTAMGEGVAIPHGKLAQLENMYLVFGRSHAGVPFDALDGKACHLFFMVLAPEGAAVKQLGLLGHLARLLKNESFRLCIMNAKNHDELWRLLSSS